MGARLTKNQSDLADFRRFSRTTLHPFGWLSEVVVSKMLMLSMGYYLTTCNFLWGYIEGYITPRVRGYLFRGGSW
jgi:hypothetical protein